MPAALLVLLLSLGATATAQVDDEAARFAREDPERFLGAEACGECHVSELEVWKRTPHSTGFRGLHRRESAEKIARAMGFRLIKRQSLCIRCHYTPTVVSDQLRALSGVSCESCHGAGRDWIDIHNDYGGRGVDFSTETAEHRQQRIEASVSAGMRRPSLLYDVAKSCFGCHLVPEEDLVNNGGHGTGSGTFELVEWSQGQIRHNYLDAQRGGSDENRERTAELKRVMYVIGRAVELETALRGVSAATTNGVYVKAMQRRVRLALGEVREIAARTEMPELDELLEAVRGVRVKLGNGPALIAAADRIGEVAQRIPARYDGSQLADLDGLVLGLEEEVDEQAFDELVADAEVDPADAVVVEGDPVADAPSSAPDVGDVESTAEEREAAGDRAATTQPRSVAPRVVGKIKRRIRPTSPHKTLGSACSRCHAEQNEWWFDDPHYASAEPFFDQETKNVQIARFYGLDANAMTKGNQVCMDCHGTVVTGRERRDAQDGVGCESCHGAAGDYIEIHQEGDKAQGRDRPGYRKALAQGMLELADLEVRAGACTGCHYITEPRLISAGHPSGSDFDYVAAMSSIQHWQHTVAPGASIRQAFSTEISRRGAVPDVPRAQLADAPAAGGAGPSVARSDDRPARDARVSSPRTRPSLSRTPDSADERIAAAATSPIRPSATARRAGPIESPDFAPIDETASIEEILSLLKERLDELHRRVFQDPGR